MNRNKIIFLLFIAMFAVSFSPIIAKTLTEISSSVISFWRMVFATLLIYFISKFSKQSKMEKKNYFKSILAGIFLGLHFVFFFKAIKFTSISNATFLGTLAPFFTFIIEVFFFKRKVFIKQVSWLFIILFGSFILVFNNFDIGGQFTVGNIYAIICSFFFGIVFIISNQVRKDESLFAYTKVLYFIASLTLLFICLINKENIIDHSSKEYILLFLLGLGPTVIGHSIFNYSVKYISPTVVACFPLGEPIIASVFAFILFNESLNIAIFVGGPLILFGLLNMIITNKEI